ncbi:hypothetical protein RRG08_046828 [Elysia crispata]|uniref:Uncharacterized protein n=1 Tax=Elysia crispata TaxID=231223 RepID=A0AAE0ZPJ9_9GAST|nr:hypothetical protein RRG08_046828 [Elysia crispata]
METLVNARIPLDLFRARANSGHPNSFRDQTNAGPDHILLGGTRPVGQTVKLCGDFPTIITSPSPGD